MKATQTNDDFDNLSWHDCHIWRLDFNAGDPATDDWTSDLVLGLDFITEWICGVGGGGQFRIAPAFLAFHGVTDPRINIEWGDSGFQNALYPMSIHRIGRAPVENQKVYLDRPYYRWQILLNMPEGGEIAFGAVGFTQTLLAEPVLCEEQQIPPAERRRLMGDHALSVDTEAENGTE